MKIALFLLVLLFSGCGRTPTPGRQMIITAKSAEFSVTIRDGLGGAFSRVVTPQEWDSLRVGSEWTRGAE